MQKIYPIWPYLSIAISLFLSACSSGGSGDESEPANPPSAPILQAIGDQIIAFNEEFSLTLQASDRNGDMVRFSANANMGPGANPFIGDNPAQFDETQGIFSWTPSAAQAGEYHVTFIATDESAAQLSSEESIAIRVTSLGEKLFLSHCSECHGEDAQGSNTVPAILFKTALDINNAIDSVDRMNYLRDELSQPDIEEIASFLDLNANI